MQNYYVIIEQDNQIAKLKCINYNDALSTKIAFENYGKCQSVTIELITE